MDKKFSITKSERSLYDAFDFKTVKQSKENRPI